MGITVTGPKSYIIKMAAPQGPPGPSAGRFTLPITSPVGGHRVIACVAGEVFYADQTNLAHFGKVVGFTESAASSGEVGLLNSGTVDEPSWTWVEGPLYVGTNGVLTQTAPTTGFLQEVAIAATGTKIVVNLQPPILLSGA